MSNRVVVIGGGPAGLMAAGQAALRGLEVYLLERNPRPARKLLITGKGRCNITNALFDVNEVIENVVTNGRFLYSALTAFMTYDTVAFFEERGVKTKTERGNRVFPESDKAVSVVDAMVSFAKESGVLIKTDTRVSSFVFEDGKISAVVLENGGKIDCGAVILATGGKSYPGTGSTGDGYRLAASAGHTVTEIRPSLVPMTVHQGWCSDLMGLSLKNTGIKILDEKGKSVYADFGEMLFTHFGVSGPMILSASAHLGDIRKKKFRLVVDLKPALTEEQLEARILRDFKENANKDFINSLSALLPHKMIPVIVRLSGIEPGTKCNQITKAQRRSFVRLLKNLELDITGFRPIDEAIVTSGGVKVSEIEPKTMRSKLMPNLYFAGEVIDTDAYTGGFNLQIAFSTGYLAGTKVLEERTK